MNSEVNKILEEDARRRAARAAAEQGYDPIAGRGACGPRCRVSTPVPGLPHAMVPESMKADADYAAASHEPLLWQQLRCRHDFEYWCARCVTIKHKTTGCMVPFVLNAPQRRLAALLEADRRAGRPMRVIMLKARQWGGSTLVQMYMAWMQCCVRRNWHSLICAHVKDTAAAIRGMYTRMLENYPADLWTEDAAPRFSPFERSINTREIAGRGCRVTVGSAENQEAIRGSDYAMAHLSETAFWRDSTRSSPDDFIRAINGAIALVPDTLIVMESTANGVGSYFHNEWMRSREGRSDKHAVFVPWYEIEIYRLEPHDPAALAASLTDAERGLWRRGLCLDQINWYRHTLRAYSHPARMQAEYPGTDTEAFLNSGSGVFAPEAVERLRRGCLDAPEAAQGEFTVAGFRPDSLGRARMWAVPAAGARYVVAVDIGGRSEGADWSVVVAMRTDAGSTPEVVAQWRGHIDHDLLVEKAEWMARHYNNAMLIIESNTLETESEGDPNLFVLSRLADRYTNLYCRRSYDSLSGSYSSRVGFHTNRATKAMIISELIAAVRDGGYIERDNEACNELLTYEQQPGGGYGARRGCHDDILITRALALHAAGSLPPPAPPGVRPWRSRW